MTVNAAETFRMFAGSQEMAPRWGAVGGAKRVSSSVQSKVNALSGSIYGQGSWPIVSDSSVVAKQLPTVPTEVGTEVITKHG
jgi:hypothetical protein